MVVENGCGETGECGCFGETVEWEVYLEQNFGKYNSMDLTKGEGNHGISRYTSFPLRHQAQTHHSHHIIQTRQSIQTRKSTPPRPVFPQVNIAHAYPDRWRQGEFRFRFRFRRRRWRRRRTRSWNGKRNSPTSKSKTSPKLGKTDPQVKHLTPRSSTSPT